MNERQTLCGEEGGYDMDPTLKTLTAKWEKHL